MKTPTDSNKAKKFINKYKTVATPALVLREIDKLETLYPNNDLKILSVTFEPGVGYTIFWSAISEEWRKAKMIYEARLGKYF